MIFKNNKVYNVLKYLALVVFDALGLAYEQLAEVWDLPYGTQVMRTCVIISTLVGALIGLSNAKYNKQLDYTEHEDAGVDLYDEE